MKEDRIAAMAQESMLSYYQKNEFNPVPIALDTSLAWQTHSAKRRNLYERHLGIPLSFLRGRSVLEFGCNSGENALALASVGANLTLVEPNQQVWSRLTMLFKQYGFEKRIEALLPDTMQSFETETRYDVVVAEGFLFTLPNREELLQKICKLLAPGGRGIVSFNDRYGMLLESTKRMLLRRACQLTGIDDAHSEASLELAIRLFGQDYAQLNASRPFEAWWKDSLVSPFLGFAYLWSHPEILPLIETAGGEFHSCSPQWLFVDHFNWYKNLLDACNRHQEILDNWAATFPYFLTGLCPLGGGFEIATSEVVDSVSEFIARISEYTIASNSSITGLVYPLQLDKYLGESEDSRLVNFNSEMKALYQAVQSNRLQDVLLAYSESESLRRLWGAPYHYICFSKLA